MPSYVDDVLNAIYAGEKILISFSSPSERERFRQTLYRQKCRQDFLLRMISEEKKKTLKFLPLLSVDPAAADTKFQATVFLEERAFSFQTVLLQKESSTNAAEGVEFYAKVDSRYK